MLTTGMAALSNSCLFLGWLWRTLLSKQGIWLLSFSWFGVGLGRVVSSQAQRVTANAFSVISILLK